MVDEIKITLKNAGSIRPEVIEDYISYGGFDALKLLFLHQPFEIIEKIEKSGLRGRGGAGFSTGLKNRFSAQNCNNCQKYIVCNADEGEPGTFKDRIIMENIPYRLIEGMLISAYSIGASKGYIYVRGEYYLSIERLNKAIQNAYDNGFLGNNILNSGFNFDIEVKTGAGSYLCGEELTLLESLLGKRGYPRIKPPFPAEKGLLEKPTLINNVETLTHLPAIIQISENWYNNIGTEKSKGTKIITISGNVNNPGYFEVPFGVSLRDLIFEFAGGIKNGKKFKGALLGGAAGTFTDKSMLDIPMCYDLLKENGLTLGSGAIIVFDDEQSVFDILTSILKFFRHESCGKCILCRGGTAQIHLKMEEIKEKENREAEFFDLINQAEIMAKTSLCPLGQSLVLPMKSAVKYFKNELINKQIL